MTLVRAQKPICAHEDATHFHVHLNWSSSTQMLLVSFFGTITLWCCEVGAEAQWLPFNLARFEPQWKKTRATHTRPLQIIHSVKLKPKRVESSGAESEICQKAETLTLGRIGIGRNLSENAIMGNDGAMTLGDCDAA